MEDKGTMALMSCIILSNDCDVTNFQSSDVMSVTTHHSSAKGKEIDGQRVFVSVYCILAFRYFW